MSFAIYKKLGLYYRTVGLNSRQPSGTLNNYGVELQETLALSYCLLILLISWWQPIAQGWKNLGFLEEEKFLGFRFLRFLKVFKGF